MNLPGIENYDSLKEARRTWVDSAIAGEGHDREVIGFSRSSWLWLYGVHSYRNNPRDIKRYNDIRADFMERGVDMGDERQNFSERVVM